MTSHCTLIALIDHVQNNQTSITIRTELDAQLFVEQSILNGQVNDRKYLLLREIHPEEMHAVSVSLEKLWLTKAEIVTRFGATITQYVLQSITHTRNGITVCIPCLMYHTKL